LVSRNGKLWMKLNVNYMQKYFKDAYEHTCNVVAEYVHLGLVRDYSKSSNRSI
jgi:hypothetical protein